MAKKESVTPDELQKASTRYKQTYPLMVLNLFALIVVICVHHLFLQSMKFDHPYIFLFVMISPLLLLIPGGVKGSYRGAIWICFVTLIYFVAGVLNWTQGVNWAYGVSQTLLSFLLFNIALMYARWKGLSELPVKK
ncbi:DUF2069 domain-containing protein [Marinomonas sp. 2405UD68-3]|uniref:DUF2069 domain-containing protein n=1 Tax=Marinomonas sp. 2405UD68-3 TaxID=3391835 RepID=UPI0039C998C6